MRQLLLVSESTVMRLGLQALVGANWQIEPCNPGTNPSHALARVSLVNLDLVVIDGDLGREPCLVVCSVANSRWPDAPNMVIANMVDEEFVRAVVEAGARGYVCKDSDPEELRSAVDWLLKGQAVLDPRVTGGVLAWLLQVDAAAHREELSTRELEVLRLVSKGEPNKRIARQLGVGENTVKTYLRRAYTKLGCRTRSAAAAEVIKRGWI